MDGFTFITSMTKAIAWPAFMTILICMFKPQFAALFQRLSEISFPGGGAKFEPGLTKVEEAAQVAKDEGWKQLTNESVKLPYSILEDPLIELAKTFPEAAILESFKELDAALRNTMDLPPHDLPPAVRFSSIVAHLKAEELLSGTYAEMFREMQQLRNIAAHAGPKTITPAEAVRYRDQCQTLLGVLAGIRKTRRSQLGHPET